MDAVLKLTLDGIWRKAEADIEAKARRTMVESAGIVAERLAVATRRNNAERYDDVVSAMRGNVSGNVDYHVHRTAVAQGVVDAIDIRLTRVVEDERYGDPSFRVRGLAHSVTETTLRKARKVAKRPDMAAEVAAWSDVADEVFAPYRYAVDRAADVVADWFDTNG